jgi:hypothetical protein
LEKPNRYWGYTIGAILLGVYGYAGADFYAGLELIRPLFIFIFLLRSNVLWKNTLKKTISCEIPYFVPYLVFILWRGFIFESQTTWWQLIPRK